MNQLLDQNLVQVGIRDDGTEIVIALADAGRVPRKTILRCKDVVVFHWHRTQTDSPPYIIPELSWDDISVEAIPKLLKELGYSFFDADGMVWHRFARPLVYLKLEGAICADVLCASVDAQ